MIILLSMLMLVFLLMMTFLLILMLMFSLIGWTCDVTTGSTTDVEVLEVEPIPKNLTELFVLR